MPVGFNPCCIGLAIAAGMGNLDSSADSVFQSLLYWISHCGKSCESGFLEASNRFNPCCIGLAIAARGMGSLLFGCPFVSILVVLD